MNQLCNTFMNCVRLRSFKYFNVLYKEVPFKVIGYDVAGHALFRHDGVSEPDIIAMGKFSCRVVRSTALLHELANISDSKTSACYLLVAMQRRQNDRQPRANFAAVSNTYSPTKKTLEH